MVPKGPRKKLRKAAAKPKENAEKGAEKGLKELAEELKRGIAQEVKKAVTASLDEFEQNEKGGESSAKPKVQRPLVIRKARRASEGKVYVLSDSGCTWTVCPESKKPESGVTLVDADGAFGAQHRVVADEQDEALYGGDEHMMSDRQAVRGGWVKICMEYEGTEFWEWLNLSDKWRASLRALIQQQKESDRVTMTVERGVPELLLEDFHKM